MQASWRWVGRIREALPGPVRRRPAAFGAGLGAVVLAGVAGVCLWPASESGGELPTARVYRDVDACLLADSRGVAPGVPAAPVWAGMQEASRATRARVSFLSAMGPDTQANVVPYVNSLVQEHCSVVVAVGSAEVRAARSVAPHQKGVRFVVVGDGSDSANVSVVKAGNAAQVREGVRGAVASLTGTS
ncbi:BMP family ABC transporter substrate-binding protein [Streptomyces sp. NPDC048242]|uniref:BMP family ABC transporter substrate-binding protein n=1 Tax=Streptomyces sp. NPDC048242 TaxID=3155026 RepID=UPI0034150A5D